MPQIKSMNYLSVENLSKHYGDLVLFEDISFGLEKGDKTALIAKNGSGKSSLLKILAGLDGADNGAYVFNNEARMAYLPQTPVFDASLTIDELLQTSHSETLKIIRQYEDALNSQGQNYSEKSQKLLDAVSAKMDVYNAWDYEDRVKQMLGRFGIFETNLKISKLSGGQKKRLALAFTLLDNPDFLILDEPTNHLDINMIEWLEDYLSKANITILMVTHDRYFLDNVCNNVLELSFGRMFVHRGNYAWFLEKKAERIAAEQSQIEGARNYMRNEIDWMRRMPKARTSKSKTKIESFYKAEEIAKSGKIEKDVQFDFKSGRIGKKILELKKVSKSFGDKKLVDNLEYIFKRGETVGVVGPNGCGKSTLLNIITSKLSPDRGEVIKGETINFGYYQQSGLDFDPDKKVIEILTDIAENVKTSKNQVVSVSRFLNWFLFEPKVQNNLVSTLSGGELRRLYLLTVLIKNPNFLILDEPTNDLDIETLNRLEEFLQDYEGCVILVSHDRYLMDRLCDHIFVFKGEGEIKDYYGNYTEYRLVQKKEDKKQKVENASKQKEKKSDSIKVDKPKTKLTFNEVREHKQLETYIAKLETEKTELEEKLNSGMSDYEELQKLSARISQIIDDLDEKTLRWMELEEYL